MRHRFAPAALALAAAVLLSLSFAAGASHRPLENPSVRATSQAAAHTDGRVDAGRLMDDVRALAAPKMEGRLAGSAGSLRARQYILSRFREMRLAPVKGTYVHPFRVRGARQGRQTLGGTNLLGMIEGRVEPQRFVIVSAHYDHVGIHDGSVHPGADDNASGVAALLAVAGWLTRERAARSVLFAAFDAEEQGLRGSRAFVETPPIDLRQVVAIVNLDMLARGDDNRLVVAGTSHHPQLKPPVGAAARGRRLTVTFGYDRPASEAPGTEDWTRVSDHGPFHDAGVPFLYFGVDYHADYHKPTDTADRIPVPFFVEATEIVLETVSRLAGSDF